MKNKAILFILFAFAACSIAQAQSDNSVEVVFNGTSATVSVADNISQYLTVTQQGAHVSIAQSDSVASEITYTLSGTSTDGEFYMSGSYKATVELNGLTLTNATPVYSGAAVHIQNGKRINVKVITGTTNTLVDAATGSQKGCLYVKGHAEFKQQGTLNVVGNVKHAIKAGEYISLKNATLNITSAVGDGISCNQYFLMESGIINISGTEDDGIQCDLEGNTATAITEDHEDEDSGNIYIEGGNITINCAAIAAKGIKAAGDIFISGEPVIDVTTSGKGTWDEDDLETKAACGISADGDIDISGGTLTLTATGSGGKGMKCDSVLTISGGDITVTTSGGLYYNNGTIENTNYTGNTDNVSSDYYSSPKGIKAGVKTQVSNNSYTYSGGMVISGGNIKVTTSGYNGEGIESKNYLNIEGGEIYINAYDDGINSAQDMTITGGYLYSLSNHNDGIDANGNVYLNGGLVYAIGSGGAENAIDANSEGGKKVYVNGGVIIAVGGIENGATYNQPKIQQSSVSSNTWYTVTYGDNTVAFKTPTISTGGGHGGPGGNSSGLVISTPSTPSLATGNNVNDGTSHFEGNCYVGGDRVGIYDVETEQQIVNDPRVFSIDGRYLGTEVPSTFRGVYIQNGKKHIKLQ
ncbi:MAG: carbohydrate-binding domain-containing protein [Bacteroidales bacterium]|nr:carbohydrate-binding domain-containing protein [Bacteroidales bacterium]MBR6991464.1 carbohydrate-binding domain-containing protein [Bacteroidales bacterium]